MYIFVGLGNIGREYEGTRHNIGFAIVDALERDLSRSLGWRPGKGDYYYAKGMLGIEEVVLVKPTTYMNLSGRAVRDVMAFFKCEISNVVVICDDIALPTGKLRLRLGGSDGGHNGLSSIIYEIGSDAYPRLRCGVGNNFHKGQQANYVLGKFPPAEATLIEEMIAGAIAGLKEITKNGMEKAMNKVNT